MLSSTLALLTCCFPLLAQLLSQLLYFPLLHKLLKITKLKELQKIF